MIDLSAIMDGIAAALQPGLFVYVVGGFLVGVFFGAVPGLTATVAIAVLLPITYGMAKLPALAMCMGIFMAGMYAGSITATTLNIPGAPAAMMTAIEGHPLMRKGEGGKALGHAAFASALGGTIGAVLTIFLLLLAAPYVSFVRTADKFSLIVFALVTVGLIQKGSCAKAFMATALGLMLATVGIDPTEPVSRFDYGISQLTGGLELLALCIGLFAISEVLVQVDEKWHDPGEVPRLRRRDLVPRLGEIRRVGVRTYVKSIFIGYAIGVLPGAGASAAAFVSYAEAIRSSRHPETFGKGEVQGIAAAETANNAMCGGAMLPMVLFGIPGDATTAVVMGVLLIHGLVPGPHLVEAQFHIIAPVLASLALAAALLIVPSLLIFGPYYVRLVRINRAILYSSIAMVALVGAYVATYDMFQVGFALAMGVVAFFLRRLGYPVVPLLIGFILGPMGEQFLRRTLLVSGGSLLVLFTRPVSAVLLGLTAVFIYYLGIRPYLAERKLARDQSA